jgi:oxygen-independent coproporphyrinogen-3 oxidase
VTWGVYVHFPFCVRRCPYCDFNVVAQPDPPHLEYRDAVLAELAVRAPDFSGRGPLASVYFGGGTPGLWRPDCVGAVLGAIDARFGVPASAEVTLEMNPDDATPERFAGLRAAGVNRLSLGTQSFDDDLLARLGRRNRADDNRRAISGARAAGFDDLSLDLIQGAAGQSIEAALADVDAVLSHGPTHVSTYQLTIEERTPFGARAARGEVLVVDDDVQAGIYEETRLRLRAGGVAPYEISNAARPGREAVHNSLYWTGGEYLALGAGAHGFRRLPDGRAERWENARHPGRYQRAAVAAAPAETFRETLDAATLSEESLMCGLRLDRGVAPTPAHRARFGTAADRLGRLGLLAVGPDRWQVTDRGRLLLNTLLADLLSEPQAAEITSKT